jgi:hypothetical protein
MARSRGEAVREELLRAGSEQTVSLSKYFSPCVVVVQASPSLSSLAVGPAMSLFTSAA